MIIFTHKDICKWDGSEPLTVIDKDQEACVDALAPFMGQDIEQATIISHDPHPLLRWSSNDKVLDHCKCGSHVRMASWRIAHIVACECGSVVVGKTRASTMVKWNRKQRK